MAEKSLFFNTNGVGDGVSTYNQTNMFDWIRTFFGEGVIVYGGNLACTGTGATITVASGIANVYGSPYENTAPVEVTLPNSILGTTGHLIALRKDWVAQTVRVTRISSADGVSLPPNPDVNPGVTYDVPLCSVQRTTEGVSTVTDLRQFATFNAVVGTDRLVDASVTANKLASNAVTTAKILDANVTADKLASNSVTTAKITDANVTADKLASNSVTTAKITDANVTADKLASNSVTTAKIADNNITTAKILDANVTTAKILDANVTADKLASNAVTTAKIANANVTASKLAAVESWNDAPFNTGWEHYANENPAYTKVQYYKDHFGTVYIRGTATKSISGDSTILTLPAGYRPNKIHMFTTVTVDNADGTGANRLELNTSGVLTLYPAASNYDVVILNFSFRV